MNLTLLLGPPLPAQDAAPSQTSITRARRNLAKCTWEPCLPGQEVYAFVSALPLPRQSKYNVFNALCHCGVENAEDLDALSYLDEHLPHVQQQVHDIRHVYDRGRAKVRFARRVISCPLASCSASCLTGPPDRHMS